MRHSNTVVLYVLNGLKKNKIKCQSQYEKMNPDDANVFASKIIVKCEGLLKSCSLYFGILQDFSTGSICHK